MLRRLWKGLGEKAGVGIPTPCYVVKLSDACSARGDTLMRLVSWRAQPTISHRQACVVAAFRSSQWSLARVFSRTIVSCVVFRVCHEGIRKLAVTRQATGIVYETVLEPQLALHGGNAARCSAKLFLCTRIRRYYLLLGLRHVLY